MCGSLDSSLGIKLGVTIQRWRDGVVNKNELETAGRLQFNAVVADIDEATGLAREIRQVQKVYEQ
jgi:calcineurin-like phosphoesterase